MTTNDVLDFIIMGNGSQSKVPLIKAPHTIFWAFKSKLGSCNITVTNVGILFTFPYRNEDALQGRGCDSFKVNVNYNLPAISILYLQSQQSLCGIQQWKILTNILAQKRLFFFFIPIVAYPLKRECNIQFYFMINQNKSIYLHPLCERYVILSARRSKARHGYSVKHTD